MMCSHHVAVIMRTTLNLDPEILAAARRLAAACAESIGEIISQLARKGLAADTRTVVKHGFPVFEVARRATDHPRRRASCAQANLLRNMQLAARSSGRPLVVRGSASIVFPHDMDLNFPLYGLHACKG